MTIVLNEILTKLNEGYSQITDLVSVFDDGSIFYFSDESYTSDPTEISDGGNDLFDGGNRINVDEMQGDILYTHTPAEYELDDSTYTNPPMDGIVTDGSTFGCNEYFTNMYPGLFVFTATNPNHFRVSGNMGSDGSEIVTSDDENQSEDGDGYIHGDGFKLTVNGKIYTVYTRFSKDGDNSDPTLNHIVIVSGEDNSWDHSFTSSYDEMYYDIIDFNSNKPEVLYFLVIATWSAGGDQYNGSDGDYSVISNASNIATKFLNIVTTITASRTIHPTYTFEVVAFDIIELMGQALPDTLENTLYSLSNRTVWIETVDRSMKHGDRFSAFGQNALYLKKLYVDVDSPLLKIYVAPAPIVLFSNTDYVDYDINRTSAEASNVKATLESQGFTVSTFTDITSSGFAAATELAGTTGVMLIPELENNDLNPDLTSDARSVILNWVDGGGNLVMFCPNSGDPLEVLNAVFDFSLSFTEVQYPIALVGGGIFAGAAAIIPENDATEAIHSGSLPSRPFVASTVIYSDLYGESVVTLITVGSGSIFVLGWDWYDAAPVGVQDEGWNDVLYRFVNSKVGV